jgi:hypothetical protein
MGKWREDKSNKGSNKDVIRHKGKHQVKRKQALTNTTRKIKS